MRNQKIISYNNHGTQIKVVLFYDSEQGIEEVSENIHNAIEANVLFYKDCTNLPTSFNITLLSHRWEYDEVLGYQSSSWGSGLTRNNNIYTFHPDRRAIETSHSRESFVNTLTHEMSHIFSKNIFGKELWWIKEGVAQYIAKQDTFKDLEKQNIEHFISHSLDKNIKYSDFVNNYQGHQISKKMGYAIGKKFGSKVLLSLLAVSSEDEHSRLLIAKILNVPLEDVGKEVRSLLFSTI